MYLYETHLPVKDTEVSSRFYVDVVGLEYAHRDLTRDIVFLWVGSNKRSMLGLWGPTTSRGEPRPCHFAVATSLPELLAAGSRLSTLGVVTRDFSGKITTEPSVIGWMPSAQLYFSDPDDTASNTSRCLTMHQSVALSVRFRFGRRGVRWLNRTDDLPCALEGGALRRRIRQSGSDRAPGARPAIAVLCRRHAGHHRSLELLR